MTPHEAYEFVKNNPDCDIEKYQEIALQDPEAAYLFAANIPGADINACQEAACKSPEVAAFFLKIKGADKDFCMKAVNSTLAGRSFFQGFYAN